MKNFTKNNSNTAGAESTTLWVDNAIVPTSTSKVIKGITLILMLFFFNASNATAYFSRLSGNWNSNTTWSLTSGGGAVGTGVFPIAGDTVTIEGGFNVTLTANAACASITFTATTATSLTLGTFQLDVSGLITIPRSGTGFNQVIVGSGTLNAGSVNFTSGGTTNRHQITISTGTVNVTGDIIGANASATIVFTGAGTLNVGGALLATGTLTTFAGSTVNYNGAAQNVKGGSYLGNLTFSGSGTKTFLAATTVSATVTVANGVVVTLGTFASTAAQLVLNGVTQTAGGTTYGSTASTATTTNATYFGTTATGLLTVGFGCSTGIWTGTTSTDWNVSTNWCNGILPTSSTNVTISSGGNQPTIGAAGGVCNSITINTGATLTITGSNTLTVYGNWTNNGTFTRNTSTVVFNGTTQSIGTGTFYNVTISGTGTKSLGVATTVNGALTINSGTTLATANFGLTLAGNFTNSGTFTAGSSAITITGTATQNIAGFTTTGAISVTKTGGTATITSNVSAATFSSTTAAMNSTVALNSGVTLTLTGGITIARPANTAVTGFNFNVGAGIVTCTTITLSGTTGTARTSNLLLSTGTITASSNITSAGVASSIVFSGSGIINVGGSFLTTAATFTASTGTVNYNGTTQTIGLYTYYNLTLSGSGTKTFPTGATTVNGVLSIENGTSTNTFTGTLTYGTGATLQYNAGASNRTVSNEWPATFLGSGGVLIKGTGIITLNAAKVLGTNTNVPLNITSGAKLATGNFGLTFHGDFINSGTFTGGSSAIILTGTTTTQNIGTFTTTGALSMTKTSGTATVTGNISAAALTINGTGGTLHLGSNLTHSFSGNVTLTSGTLNGGVLSTINATSSTTSAWNGTGTVFVPGTSTVVFGGTAQTIGVTNPSFYNVSFSGTTATKTISNALTVDNNINIISSAVVLLPNGTTSTTKVLQYGGVSQAGGSYGGSTSAASNKNATYFGSTTTGILNSSTAQRFIISGTATQTAGATQNITITATNADGSTFVAYTGDKSLTFSGATTAPNGTVPTIIDKNGTAVNFGTATTVTFSSGIATVSSGSNGVMALYKVENAIISATDGTITSSGSDRLFVNVTVGTSALVFSTQPGGGTTNSIWATQPVVTWSDTYENLVTGISKDVTLAIATNPSSGTLSGTKTVALNTTTAQALFSGLSIDTAGSGYTLSAAAPSVTGGTSSGFAISNPVPTVSILSPSTVCSGGVDFVISITGTNFNSGSVVKINGVSRTTTFVDSTSLTATILASDIVSGGTPSVTVFNATPGGGDSSSSTLTVTQIVINQTVTQPTCYSDGSISLSPSGGLSPYNYDWNDISGSNNAKDRSGLIAGNYSVSVSDSNGCISTSGTISFTAATGCTGISVCKSDTASILSVPPDPNNLSYTWSLPTGALINSGQGTATISVNWTGVAAGGYPITVVATNDCGTSSASNMTVYIEQPTAVVTSDLACTGSDLNLYASGGISYVWSGPNGFSSQSANPIIYNATTSLNGTYTVTVTNTNGCSASASTSISVNSTPSISSSVSNPTGGNSNGSITLTSVSGGSGFTYSWTAQNNIQFTASTQNVASLASDNYTVLLSNSSGCSTTQTFSLSDLTVSVSASTNVACNGDSNGSITLNTPSGGTAPYSYLWSASNGGSIPSGQSTNQNLTDLAAGKYSVIITDSNGLQGYANVTITEPNIVQADNVITNVSCYGASTGAISIIVSGGTPSYTYDWSGPNGFTASTQNISNRAAGVYDVTITDGNGCTLQHSYTISQPEATLNATPSITTVNCFGTNTGQVILTVTGGTSPYGYTWTGPSSFSASTKDIANLIAGNYSVAITDSKGCTFSLTGGTEIVVSQPAAAVTISIASQTNVGCKGAATGAINISVSGGTSPYTYSWNTGATTEDISGLSAGVYVLTVTDNKGCTASNTVTITEPSAVLSASIGSSNPNCNAAATGSIDLTVSGGTAPYTYLWSTNATTQDLNLLNPGQYTVVITDNNGCTVGKDSTIIEPAPLTIAATVVNVLCNSAVTGSLTLEVTGGTGVYTYDWDDVIGTTNSKDRSSLPAGTYGVTVTDENSCTASAIFTVTEIPALELSFSTKNILCKDESNGSISLSVSGGTYPYTFSWTGSASFTASTQNIVNVPAGSYSITVTDSNSCTISESGITLTQPSAALSVNTTPSNITCLDGSNGSITASASGGTAPYTYAWSNGATTSSVTNLVAGSYTLEVKDSKGCSSSTTVVLTQPTTQLELYATTKDASSCGGSTGAIDLSVVNGNSPFNYAWTNTSQTSQDPTNLAANTYTVTVTDNVGCSAVLPVTIGSASSLSVSLTTYPKTCIYNDGTAYAIVSGGVPPYTYLWGNGATTQDIGLLSSGSVSITVTDTNGCTVSNTGTVGSISCTPPVANNDAFTTDYNTPLSGSVGTNDTDPDGDNATLQYFSDQLPTAAQGVLTWGSDFNGSFTFTPTSGYAGTFSLTYFVFDITGLKTIGTYTITVGPHAINDSFGTPLNTVLSSTVASNDIYEVGSNFTKITDPLHGVVVFNSNGTFTYTPTADYAGDDSFTYQVCLPVPNATICSSATVYVSVDGSADVQITKTVNTNTPNVGGNVVFTLTATNNGPNLALGVLVSDVLPSGYTYLSNSASIGNYDSATGVWSVGSLLNSSSATIDITATVNPIGNYTNSASISSDSNDPGTLNNSDSVSTIPIPQSDIALVQSVDNPSQNVGSNVVFTLTVTNNGPSNSTGVNLTDLLPSGFTYISSATNTGSYDSVTGIWTIGSLASGSSITLTITASIDLLGDYTNTATVSSTTNDPVSNNNEASQTVVPGAISNLSLTKTMNIANPYVGSVVEFTLTATNHGPSEATHVSVTDLLPSGYTYSYDNVTGNYNAVSGVWNVGTLANNASATLIIGAIVNTSGNYTNSATIASDDQPDDESSNNTATVAPTTVVPQADLSIVKSVNTTEQTIGQNVIFTLTVTNNGPSNATNVAATDMLPSGYSYVSSQTVTGSYNSTNGIWTIGSLANGTTVNITITAHVNESGNYLNSASIDATTADLTTSNDTSSKTITPIPVLIITNPSACGAASANLTTSSVTEGSTPGLTFTYWLDSNATVPYATPSAASTGIYYIKGSLSEGGFAIAEVQVSANSNIWSGALSTDWNTAGNWVCGYVPSAGDSIEIPTSASNYPTLDGPRITGNLNLATGTTLNLNDTTLTVTGIFTGTGTLIGSPDSSLEINGTGSAGTFYLNQSNPGVSNVVSNFTLNSLAGGANLGNALGISGVLTLTNGTFATNGNLTLISNANGTAVVAPILNCEVVGITGDVTVERFFPARRAFRFISSPVTTTTSIRANWQEGVNNLITAYSGNQNPHPGYGTHITGNMTGGGIYGFDATQTTNNSMFSYTNSTGGWGAVPNTNVITLNAGTPYRLMIRGDRSIDMNTNTPTPTNTILRSKGTLNICDTPAVTLSQTVNGYSFIGNPYQAIVDIQEVLLQNSNLNPNYYWAWDPKINTRGGYVAFDLDLDINPINTSGVNRYLQPWQACFIKNTSGGGTLTFTESNKSDSNVNETIYKMTSSPSYIKLNLFESNSLATHGPVADGLLIKFSSSYTNEIDGTDASKFANLDEVFATKNNTTSLGIESRALPIVSDIIPLSITQYRNTNYTIVAEGNHLNSIPAYLHDQWLQSYTEIPQEGSVNYDFSLNNSIPASIASDRFRIVYENPLHSGDVDQLPFALYPNPSKQGVFDVILSYVPNNAVLVIYNSLGQKVYSTILNSTNTNHITPNRPFATGVYYVKITDGNKVNSNKLIIE